MTIRIAILALVAPVAACTSAGRMTTTNIINPAFACATADYARNHTDQCSQRFLGG